MLRVASLALCLAAAYLTITVAGIHDGAITGLFYTGTNTRLPLEIDAEPTHRVSDPVGYDAQFYHLVLHDPLLAHGYHRWVDNAQLRWRRIGIPGAAAFMYAITYADPHWTYILLQLAFIFLGTWWLAAYAESIHLPAITGLGFLLIPATLVSLDRMTVDVSLAALTVGFVLYATRAGPAWRLYAILCVAPLIRETGILLTIAWGLWSIIRRRGRAAALSAATTIPALLWWNYVRSHAPPDSTPWLADYPLSGLVYRAMSGDNTPTHTPWLKAAWAAEHFAFLGICLAFVCCILLIRRKSFDIVSTAALVFAAFFSILGKPDIWDSAYATGRTMSPLLILLAIIAMRDRRPIYFIPILCILPRLALQFQAQLTAAIRALVNAS